MRGAVLAMVGLLGVACSDESPIGPDPDTTTSSGNSMGGNGQGGANAQGLGYVEGSRLKAKNIVYADGASQFAGWHDTELDLDCGFGLADDGENRCLPNGPATYEGTTLARFSDAGCTQLVVTGGGSCAPKPTHATQYDSCNQKRKVFSLGAGVATVYAGEPSSCNPAGASDYIYYELGAELQPASFVAASIE